MGTNQPISIRRLLAETVARPIPPTFAVNNLIDVVPVGAACISHMGKLNEPAPRTTPLSIVRTYAGGGGFNNTVTAVIDPEGEPFAGWCSGQIATRKGASGTITICPLTCTNVAVGNGVLISADFTFDASLHNGTCPTTGSTLRIDKA